MTQTKNQLKADTSSEPSLDVKKTDKDAKKQEEQSEADAQKEVSKPDSENN